MTETAYEASDGGGEMKRVVVVLGTIAAIVAATTGVAGSSRTDLSYERARTWATPLGDVYGPVRGIFGYNTAKLSGPLIVRDTAAVDRIALSTLEPGASVSVGGTLNQLEILRGANLAGAINTEKARSEFVIAPVLFELRRLFPGRFGLFSGVELNADPERGLNGVCDFVISKSPLQHVLTAPLITIVEAKNDNLRNGLGQCIAAMYAAQLVNPLNREGGNLAMLSGKLAAQAIIEAKAKDDFSAMSLSRYRELLDESIVMQDLYKIRNVTDFAHGRPHLLRDYPKVLESMAEEYLRVDGTAKKSKHRKMAGMVMSLPKRRLLADLAGAVRAMS